VLAAVDHAADADQVADLELVRRGLAPDAETRPTISWPGTQGYRVPAHSRAHGVQVGVADAAITAVSLE
jgi:hypothetical protein